MKFIDLFGGIGGFRLGLQQADKKFKCVWYCDNNKYAVEIYNKNFGEDYEPRDIRQIKAEEIPEFDMLCAGFPCQAFSVAGKRRGFDDTRGTLFFEIARIIKVKKPKIVLLENVRGLLNHNKGKTFKVILQTLDELGYEVQWMVLNSKFFGVPQNRERVFIIGYLRGISRRNIFSFKKTTKKSIEYNECNKATAIYFDDSIPKATTRRGRVMRISGALMHTPRGGVAYCLDANYHKGQSNPKKCNRTQIFNGIGFRRFTPVECERLQGFSDNWTNGVSDTQRYKQLGNAVTVNVIKYIGENIL